MKFIILVLSGLLLITGCMGPKGQQGKRGAQGLPGEVIYVPAPEPEPELVAKFATTWSDIYDSPLSPRQLAYCRSASLRADLKAIEDWIVLVNEVPKTSKGKITGVIETPCSVLKAEFPSSAIKENLKESNALYINGTKRNGTVLILSYVRVDRTP